MPRKKNPAPKEPITGEPRIGSEFREAGLMFRLPVAEATLPCPICNGPMPHGQVFVEVSGKHSGLGMIQVCEECAAKAVRLAWEYCGGRGVNALRSTMGIRPIRSGPGEETIWEGQE